MSSVKIMADTASVAFDRFDLESYRLFLRCKRLPERRLGYDLRTGAYQLTTPARFAGLLAPDLAIAEPAAPDLAEHLFDYQAFIVSRALDARRFAIWADTGLGKTAMFLEFARQVVERTGGRVLIFSPLGIIEQTRAEHQRFYSSEGGALTASGGDPAGKPHNATASQRPSSPAVERLSTRAELAEWCRLPGPGIGITNYEKMIDGILNELRLLAGVVLDESSILKSGGGVIKWNLIKSARGVEYKLSCTATPAPNDTMEYASQASFLEKLRSEGEILWTYFTRDKHGTWSVKAHARDAFYHFMATWSIFLRDPASYGWRDVLASLPPPEYFEEEIPLSEPQRRAMQALQVELGAGLFSTERMGTVARSKLAQLAKGFVYRAGKATERVEAPKPRRVAEIVRKEARAGRAVLVWTTFDEESAILGEELADAPLQVGHLSGKTSAAERERTISAFKAGELQVLVSKAQLIGYGMNFQHVRSMVFSGFDDSFERMYQAVRRAYRYGQAERVRVFIPYVPELEGLIFENVRQKEARFLSEAGEQEKAYLAAMRDLGAVA